MLADTDMLIWHLRGYPNATQRLDRLPKLMLSVVTYLKLLQGMRNRAELLAVQKSLALRQAERLPLTPAITECAIVLMEKLALSHGLQLGCVDCRQGAGTPPDLPTAKPSTSARSMGCNSNAPNRANPRHSRLASFFRHPRR